MSWLLNRTDLRATLLHNLNKSLLFWRPHFSSQWRSIFHWHITGCWRRSNRTHILLSMQKINRANTFHKCCICLRFFNKENIKVTSLFLQSILTTQLFILKWTLLLEIAQIQYRSNFMQNLRCSLSKSNFTIGN